jgi:hypothetical protein
MALGAGDCHRVAALREAFADQWRIWRPSAAVTLLLGALSQVLAVFSADRRRAYPLWEGRNLTAG